MDGLQEASGGQLSRRIFEILHVLRSSNVAGSRLQDVVLKTGLPRPTAHRLLRELIALGIAEQSDGRRYRLGQSLGAIGAEAPTPDFSDIRIANILQSVAERSGDSIAMALRAFGGVRFLLRFDGSFPVRTRVATVGEIKAFYASHAGIALMASLDDRAIANVLGSASFEANELWVGYDPVALRQTILGCIEHTRRHGWFSSVGVIAGIGGIAAVVPARLGDPHLALVISAVEPRLNPARIAELSPILLEACDHIGALIATDRAPT